MLESKPNYFHRMEIIAHQYLTKLRIIAKIPSNGQLDLTNNDLNIYNPTILNWIYRKINGDGKLNTISYLRIFYREINSFTTDLMKSIEVEKDEINKSRKYILLISLAEKIKNSTIGIDNLSRTYKEYHKVISSLESIQQDIIENQLKNIVLFVPDKYKTETLKEIEKEQYRTKKIFVNKNNRRIFGNEKRNMEIKGKILPNQDINMIVDKRKNIKKNKEINEI